MALRSNEDDNSNYPLPGLNYFWREADKTPSYDWELWLQLFKVVVIARHSISITELTREADEQNPRVSALMGNLDKTAAARKIISLLYISLRKTGRKMLMDTFPQIPLCSFNCHNSYHLATKAFKRVETELCVTTRSSFAAQEYRSTRGELITATALLIN